MTQRGFDSQSDAINYIIENSQAPITQTPNGAEKTEALRNSDKTPLQQTSFTLSPSYKNEALEMELQRFLRGQDSPEIALLLSDMPRTKPVLASALLTLRNK